MEAQRVMLVVEGRIAVGRPMDPAPIDPQDDLFPGFAEAGHHLVDILAQLLRLTVRDNVREDIGGAVLDRAKHTEQHAPRDTAPGAIAPPRLAFETLLTFDLALAEGTCGQTCALGGAPPARPRQSKTPEDCCIFIEQHELTAA